MTFESFANVNAAEALAVKVSFGDEIRRATFNSTTYVALRDLCAQLFELDSATAVLKYQDNDGDKITMSSDGEVQEALQLAKEKKILRLFVEVKAAPPPAEEEKLAEAFPCGGWRHFGGPMRGGFGRGGGFHGRGGFHGGRGGFVHGFSRGGFHNAFPHPHPHPHPHPFPPHGPHGFPGHCPAAPAPASESPLPPVVTEHVPRQDNANDQGPGANFNIPRMFGHGVFSPADRTTPFSPYARGSNFKDLKHAMKQQIRMMKATAITEEDRQAIKDFKEQMHAECKVRWHELKSEKKACKSEMKAEKKAEKAQWKEWKQDKKCEKDERLVARHVCDVTIPDNSELPADTPTTKTWRLRNAGVQAWPADSQLIFVSHRGDNLNGPERVFVGAVEPQQEVDVSVTFITPSEPGRYVGYYRMATGDGAKFGQRVWVSFIITAAAPVPMDAPTAPLLYPVVPPSATTAHAPLALPTVQAPLASPAQVPFASVQSPLASPAHELRKAPEASNDVTMD